MAFMKDIFERGYAEKVPHSERTSETQGSVWYILHQAVYHPKNPGKIASFLIAVQNIRVSV